MMASLWTNSNDHDATKPRFSSSRGWISRTRRHTKEICYWLAFLTLLLVGYKFCSDGGFSGILTLSSAFQCFSFLLLLLKIRTQKNAGGVSRRTLLLFLLALIPRLFSTSLYSGYLPMDRSGDWIYQFADGVSIVLVLVLLVLLSAVHVKTSSNSLDTFSLLLPIGLAGVLSVAVHPTLNQHWPADVAWTFALYLETFSMLPQLFLMAKIGGEVEALTSHYVASMSASRVFAFVFWLFSFNELAPVSGYNLAGWAVLLSYGAQVLICGDFMFHYLMAVRTGNSLVLPGANV